MLLWPSSQKGENSLFLFELKSLPHFFIIVYNESIISLLVIINIWKSIHADLNRFCWFLSSICFCHLSSIFWFWFGNNVGFFFLSFFYWRYYVAWDFFYLKNPLRKFWIYLTKMCNQKALLTKKKKNSLKVETNSNNINRF